MGRDFLRSGFIARLAASPRFPSAARLFTLAAFLLLIAGGLAVPHVSPGLTGILRNTSLASLVVWSLWWPLVIMSAAVLGRVWCTVCPMEMVASACSRIGLKKRIPRFLASGRGVVFFYILALLGFIRTFWAHRYPERMALFFLFLLGSAAAAGFLFNRRAFCSHLCPVGRILGLYACGAALEWRVRDPGICAACGGKNCLSRPEAGFGPAATCPSGLHPAAIRDNRDCLVCTECLKACPSRNLRLSLRKPLSDFFTGLRLRNTDLFLLVPVSGLVVWELAEEWGPARKALEAVPAAANAALGLSGGAANFVQAVILFLLFPALLLLIPAAAGRMLNKTTLLESARTFGLLLLPVTAFGHLVKALIRIASRLPYYAPAFRDPAGLETARAIAAGSLKIDDRLAAAVAPAVSILAVIVLAGAVISIGLIVRKSPVLRAFGKAGRLSHGAFAALYGLALLAAAALARF